MHQQYVHLALLTTFDNHYFALLFDGIRLPLKTDLMDFQLLSYQNQQFQS